MSAYCTSCGAPRMPLANTSVTMAGQTSKVGGTVARVFGWIVLVVGLLIALALGGLMAALGATAGWVVGINAPIVLVVAIAAYALLRGGRALKQSGDDTELATKNQAIFALANTRGGTLRAWDVAQMLQITPKEADDILTKLAKEDSDRVKIDVDDEGNVLYRFVAADWQRRAAKAVAPTMAPNAVSPSTRLRAPPMQPATRVAKQPDAAVRVDARDPLEEEFAAMEEAAEAQARGTPH
ncbi:MAG: hypothetical protein KIT84_17465 [Labilithrix sp.]|nr:hypothetical protein [Labilithrix sp.]MCW5812821.1 hypothetical protein [Labilithrix sp.]